MRFLRRLSSVCFFLVILPGAAARGQAGPPDALPEDRLRQPELAAHLRFLASDELRGRRTGSPEIDVAARYIAEQLRAAGAEPLPGTEGFLQPVPVVRSYAAGTGYVVLFGDTLRQGAEMVVREGLAARLTAPVVLAGYGISAPEAGRDDYRGVDVAGKIVAVYTGAPEGDARLAEHATPAAKRQAAARRGAVALVELYTGTEWNRLVAAYNRPPGRALMQLAGGEAPVTVGLPFLSIHDPQESYATRLERSRGATLTLDAPAAVRETVNEYNVAGLVRGSDPARAGEYLLLMAHYDHVGVNRQPGRADSIYNGARDNGMGVTAVLAAARALAERPPARSVVFLLVTGEEVGMLGSRHYAEHPLVPLEQTVFALNIDGAGFNDTGIATVVGLDRTTAEPAIRAGAAAYGLEAVLDPAPEQNLFDRSDNVVLARKGIPAPTFSPGFRAFDAEIERYYHQPADEAGDDFDFPYLLRFSQAYARAARNVADMPTAPAWKPGDKYEPAARELYGSR